MRSWMSKARLKSDSLPKPLRSITTSIDICHRIFIRERKKHVFIRKFLTLSYRLPNEDGSVPDNSVLVLALLLETRKWDKNLSLSDFWFHWTVPSFTCKMIFTIWSFCHVGNNYSESISNDKFVISANVNGAFLEEVIGEDLATLF